MTRNCFAIGGRAPLAPNVKPIVRRRDLEAVADADAETLRERLADDDARERLDLRRAPARIGVDVLGQHVVVGELALVAPVGRDGPPGGISATGAELAGSAAGSLAAEIGDEVLRLVPPAGAAPPEPLVALLRDVARCARRDERRCRPGIERRVAPASASSAASFACPRRSASRWRRGGSAFRRRARVVAPVDRELPAPEGSSTGTSRAEARGASRPDLRSPRASPR